MRRFLMMTAIAVTTMGAAQIAQAEARPDGAPPACQPDQKDHKKCPKPPHGEQGKKRPTREEGRDDARRGPPPEAGDQHEARRGPKPDERGHHEQARRVPPHGDQHQLRVGDSGRDGKLYKPGQHSRIGDAPHGKEYRVVRDKLVLVNKKDGRIVEILGPAPRRMN
ncbi:hypothetical protein [Paracoccus aestuariivivens]|uniref:RcnB family protein n=1 Tax=Paracoccus aestuariivivens TaxID=1820333 RepID=A0A6L6JD63_9RHOB|nr:hypothetical protein [Paracoccus aestuariivivens]MTH77861.1 hypothetical protein [Paracoccus aestuariivivens]